MSRFWCEYAWLGANGTDGDAVKSGVASRTQRSFETGAASVNISSQYVFDVLNEAVLAGVDQALAGGAQTGRISVVAVCYSYGVDGEGVRSLAPMGVFINTTNLNVTADGNAALHSNLRVIPPAGR